MSAGLGSEDLRSMKTCYVHELTGALKVQLITGRYPPNLLIDGVLNSCPYSQIIKTGKGTNTSIMTAGRHAEGTLSSIRTRSLQFLSSSLHACSCRSSNDAAQRITRGSKIHSMFSQSTLGLLIRLVWYDGCVLPSSSFLAIMM